jgi:hypothetical protein
MIIFDNCLQDVSTLKRKITDSCMLISRNTLSKRVVERINISILYHTHLTVYDEVQLKLSWDVYEQGMFFGNKHL